MRFSALIFANIRFAARLVYRRCVASLDLRPLCLSILLLASPQFIGL